MQFDGHLLRSWLAGWPAACFLRLAGLFDCGALVISALAMPLTIVYASFDFRVISGFPRFTWPVESGPPECTVSISEIQPAAAKLKITF